jgi:hypothetical protein
VVAGVGEPAVPPVGDASGAGGFAGVGLAPHPVQRGDVVEPAFAEFEQALIRERQAEGIAAAKARGAYKGRRRSLAPGQVRDLIGRAAAGEAKTALAKDFGISRETVYQYLRAGVPACRAPGPRDPR